MRIAIDARFLTHPQVGGFKTYSENLITALARIDTKNEYILYLDRPSEAHTKLPSQPNFISKIVPGLWPIIGMPWREQVSLARQVARDKVDLLHSPSLTAPLRLGCPLVVTIHDMIWLFPEKFSRAKSASIQRKMMEWYYRFVPKSAVQQASTVLTVSQAAKESIVQHLGISPEHVWVTHEAANHIYRPVDDKTQIEAIRSKYHLSSEFILAIGSADPRKNMTRLVQAYALLPTTVRERYKLVIVWTHHLLAADLADQIKELGLDNQVQFVKQVSNEDLVLLYNAASLFVFPSLYEGFGLPLLEAMACGTPVVAANNSSIPEIVGDAALLFEAEDINTMADVMTRVLTDQTQLESLAQKGLERASGFSWEKCARQTLAGYQQALLN